MLYKIQAGDTLYALSQKHQITVDEILMVNPQILHPDYVSINQTIIIPVETQQIVAPGDKYGYDEMEQDIRALVTRYPFIELFTIGQSVEGRNLYLLRIGRGTKQVHYNAAFHANEWITTPVLMKFLEDYAEAYDSKQLLNGYDMEYLYNTTSLYVVPMVNPDGVQLVLHGIDQSNPRYSEVLRINNGSHDFNGWKANIHGVDLNDQFPAYWQEEFDRRGVTAPAPANYPGPAPLSEPESQAMANFTRQHNFRMILAYHTQGEVIFWGYRDLEPPEAESQRIVRRFEQLSGYQPIRSVDSDAGYRDWYILEWRRPGFTVEVGRGVNPLPISQFARIYEDNIGILIEALIL